MHHLNLYRCRVPDNKANFVTGQRYNCFSDAPKELNFCQDFVAGFGHGDEVNKIRTADNLGERVNSESELTRRKA